MNKQIIGALLALAVMIGIYVSSCHRSSTEGAGIGKRVDSVLVVRHDTLVKIDSILKYKIKVVHDLAPDVTDSEFDSMIPADTFYLPSDTVKQIVTVYQEKKCIEAIDSLNAYKQIVHVDSGSIDSLAKIGKEKSPSNLIDRLRDFCAGVLVGAGLRSFF